MDETDKRKIEDEQMDVEVVAATSAVFPSQEVGNQFSNAANDQESFVMEAEDDEIVAKVCHFI